MAETASATRENRNLETSFCPGGDFNHPDSPERQPLDYRTLPEGTRKEFDETGPIIKVSQMPIMKQSLISILRHTTKDIGDIFAFVLKDCFRLSLRASVRT